MLPIITQFNKFQPTSLRVYAHNIIIHTLLAGKIMSDDEEGWV